MRALVTLALFFISVQMNAQEDEALVETTIENFIKTTKALHDSEVDYEVDPPLKKCVYFARVYDQTDEYDKDGYKNSLKAIESHFYKAEVNSEESWNNYVDQ